MKRLTIGFILALATSAFADCRLVVNQHSDIFTAPVQNPSPQVISALLKLGHQAKSHSEAINAGWDLKTTPYLKIGCFRDAMSFGCDVTLEQFPGLEDLRNGTHRQLIDRHHVHYTNPSFKRETKLFSKAIQRHMPECND